MDVNKLNQARNLKIASLALRNRSELVCNLVKHNLASGITNGKYSLNLFEKTSCHEIPCGGDLPLFACVNLEGLCAADFVYGQFSRNVHTNYV